MKGQRQGLLALLLAVAALPASRARADDVVLRNGNVISGRIVEETDLGVRLAVEGGSLFLARGQIQSVRWEDPASLDQRRIGLLDRGLRARPGGWKYFFEQRGLVIGARADRLASRGEAAAAVRACLTAVSWFPPCARELAPTAARAARSLKDEGLRKACVDFFGPFSTPRPAPGLKVAVTGAEGNEEAIRKVVLHHWPRVLARLGVGPDRRKPVSLEVRLVPGPRQPGAEPESRTTREGAGSVRALVLAPAGHPQLLTAVLAHEVGHLVFQGFVDPAEALPLCLHEGAALWAECAPRRLHLARQLGLFLATGRTEPLARLLARKAYPRAKALDPFYAQSFGLAAFLAERRGAPGLSLLADKARSLPLHEALCRVYGFETVEDLEGAWKAWAKERFPPPWKG